VARIVPYAAVHFGSYEWYRQALVDRLSTQGSGGAAPVSPVWDLFAGSAAGGTAVLLTYPLDLVRAGADSLNGVMLYIVLNMCQQTVSGSRHRHRDSHWIVDLGWHGRSHWLNPHVLPRSPFSAQHHQSIRQAIAAARAATICHLP